MRTKKTIKVLLSAAVVILAACNSGTEEAATSRSAERDGITGVQKELAGIETGMLERRLISTVVSCTGEIEVPPQGMASVTAPLGGYILKTSMVPGAFVRKGALLATLSNPEYIICI